eukprot:12200910-Alexandrium_andersonii.AAC.1
MLANPPAHGPKPHQRHPGGPNTHQKHLGPCITGYACATRSETQHTAEPYQRAPFAFLCDG